MCLVLTLDIALIAARRPNRVRYIAAVASILAALVTFELAAAALKVPILLIVPVGWTISSRLLLRPTSHVEARAILGSNATSRAVPVVLAGLLILPWIGAVDLLLSHIEVFATSVCVGACMSGLVAILGSRATHRVRIDGWAVAGFAAFAGVGAAYVGVLAAELPGTNIAVDLIFAGLGSVVIASVAFATRVLG